MTWKLPPPPEKGVLVGRGHVEAAAHGLRDTADLGALALVLRAVGEGRAQGDEEDGFLFGGVHGVLPGWTRLRVRADSPGSIAFDNPDRFARAQRR